MIIAAPILVNNVGEVVRNSITQTVSGDNGVNYRIGTEHVYFSGIEGATVEQVHNNTGIGLSVGDPSESVHAGDYWTADNVIFRGWQTSLHFNSMAMTRMRNVTILNPPEARCDFGIRVTGGSSNSHLWVGLTMGNCDVAVSWETNGCGNVILPQDVGSGRVGFDFCGNGDNKPHATVIGGNFEGLSEEVLKAAANSTVMIIGAGAQGARTTPAFNACGGYGKVIHANTAIGTVSDVMLVTGSGYGTTMGWELSLAADTEFDNSSVKWKDLPFPSFFFDALPNPALSSIGTGAIIHCIAKTTSEYHGLLQKTWDAGTSSYRWEKLNSGNYLP